jgi:hypothetical protein
LSRSSRASNELKQALDDPETSTNALDNIYDELAFKEKTDHHAKSLLNYLRNEG